VFWYIGDCSLLLAWGEGGLIILLPTQVYEKCYPLWKWAFAKIPPPLPISIISYPTLSSGCAL